MCPHHRIEMPAPTFTATVAPETGREAIARTFVAVASPAHRHATCGQPCGCGPKREDYRGNSRDE